MLSWQFLLKCDLTMHRIMFVPTFRRNVLPKTMECLNYVQVGAEVTEGRQWVIIREACTITAIKRTKERFMCLFQITFYILCIEIQLLQFKPTNAYSCISYNK